MVKVNTWISWGMEWSNCWMPHQCKLRNFTHWAWAICDCANNHWLDIILDRGSQQWIKLPLDYLDSIPCQPGNSHVNIPEWWQHRSTHVMPCLVSSFGTIWWTCNQPTWTQEHCVEVWQTSCCIMLIVRYSGWPCWLPEIWDWWTLSNIQITGTTLALACT